MHLTNHLTTLGLTPKGTIAPVDPSMGAVLLDLCRVDVPARALDERVELAA